MNPRLVKGSALMAVVFAATVAAATPRPPSQLESKLQPVAIAAALETGSGPGPRFLRADPKGNILLVDASDLSVYRVRDGEVARKPERVISQTQPSGLVRDAVPCGARDSWLMLLRAQQELRIFAGEEENKISDPEWMITSVACLGADPVVAMAAASKKPFAIAGDEARQDPELLQVWRDGAWEPLLGRSFDAHGQGGDARTRLVRDLAASEVVAAPGRGQSLWVAHTSYYEVKRINAAGRVLTTLTAGPPEIEMRDRTQAEIEALQSAMEGVQRQLPVGGLGQVPRRTVVGVSEAPAGALYVLVAPKGSSGSLAIDRYDPVEARIERVVIAIPSTTTIKSFVAGYDGLYLATPSIANGAWWIPWEQLESATWNPLTEVEIK
jgi:hypothetical protein